MYETKHNVLPFIKERVYLCRVIYTRYCRHPLSSPLMLHESSEVSPPEVNVSKRQILKNRSQHRLIASNSLPTVYE